MEIEISNWVAVIPEKEWNDWVSGKTVASFKRVYEYPKPNYFVESSLESFNLIPIFIPAEKKREENRKLLDGHVSDLNKRDDIEIDLDTLDSINSSLYHAARCLWDVLDDSVIDLYVSFEEYREITCNEEVEEISASYIKIPGYIILCEVEEAD